MSKRGRTFRHVRPRSFFKLYFYLVPKALAAELASRSITVNVIAPGLIDTAMASAEDRERILPYIPMRRLGSPDEVAAVAAFLLSDDAAYVTRAVIPVSGGLIG